MLGSDYVPMVLASRPSLAGGRPSGTGKRSLGRILFRREAPIPSVMMATETATSVLVVDDEPQVVWMLQFSLEAEGYQTYSARDGRDRARRDPRAPSDR